MRQDAIIRKREIIERGSSSCPTRRGSGSQRFPEIRAVRHFRATSLMSQQGLQRSSRTLGGSAERPLDNCPEGHGIDAALDSDA